MTRRLTARLAALEAQFGGPSVAQIDRVTTLIEELEAMEPGCTASAIRDVGFASKLPALVAESEAHGQLHRTGLLCAHCGVPA